MSSKVSESKIFVGQLSKKIRKSDLEESFSKYGKIKDIEMKTNHAFIEFESSHDAEEAVEEMDGKTVVDSKITVQLKGANRKNSSHKGPTASDVCYNCGKKGHWANECRAGDWKNRCYNCGKRGHLQKDCPKSKSRSRSRKNRHRSRSGSRDKSRDRERSRDRSRDRRRSRRYRSASSSSRSRSDTKSKSKSKSKSNKKSVSKSHSKSKSRKRDKSRSSRSRSKSKS